MNTIDRLMERLAASKTPYHTTEHASAELEAQGYIRLFEGEAWTLRCGGRYYVIRDNSALIAFAVGEESGGFRIVASHTDSPCLRVKGNPVTFSGGAAKLNVEVYGGPLLYSFLDIPLSLAGRVVLYDKESGRLTAHSFADPHTLVIPSQAIHMNREANSALSLNPQSDLQPIVSLNTTFSLDPILAAAGEPIAWDLALVSATAPFLAGFDNELLVAPRIDNLTSAYASLDALAAAGKQGVSVAYLADSEEIGSRTRTGAGSDFLHSVLSRIASALQEPLERMTADSLLVSCDNAHAIHPNHPEKSDPTNPVKLGGGVVIKHHAGGNYTTSALTDGLFRAILSRAGVRLQDFYMRADMPCGSTLGAISLGQIGIPSVDIGLAQLAMHSATETMAAADYPELVGALSAFYAASIHAEKDGFVV